MALRRRRKKLTSLLSSVDRRLKNVELRQVKGTTTSTVGANDNNNIIPPPPGVIGSETPNPWCHVIDGYWYPAQLTGAAGGLDRVELWFEADPLIEKGYGITISGVTIDGGYAPISGTYNVMGDDALWGADRKAWLVDFPNNITHTAYFTTGTSTSGYPYVGGDPATYNVQINSKVRIYSSQATTTTATITFTGPHHYQVDDIVSVVELGNPSIYYGIDGIFKVASITSNAITYTFDTPLTAGQSEVIYSDTRYVYGVAQKEVRVGATWVGTDGTTYVWNGIRYVKYTDGAVVSDGIAPSPPTALSLTSVGYNLGGGASGARAKVTASWTAPTTSSDGSPLDDLVGYRIWYKKSSDAIWTKLTFGSEETQTIDNLEPGVAYNFEILAYDSSGMESTHLAGSITTETAELASGVKKPSPPIVSPSRLGTVTVTWDGRNADGTLTDLKKLSYIEVHASTTSGFTPLAAANSSTITAASSNGTTTVTYTTSGSHGLIAGQTVTITGLSNPKFNLSNVVLATASGSTFTVTVSTAIGSPAVTISGQTGLLRSGTLKGKIYSDTDFLSISDLSYNIPYYFKFVAYDISGNYTEPSEQATAIVYPLVDVDLIAAQLNAPLTTWPYANAVITPGALASGAINASNMFGANVVVQAAIAANAIGANQIAAGAIVAGKLAANSVVANSIAALTITGDKLAVNAIDAMTITGATFRTENPAIQNNYVIMDANGLRAYNTSGTNTFNLAAGTGLASMTGAVITPSGTTGMEIGTSSTSTRGISFKISGTYVAHITPYTTNNGVLINAGTTVGSGPSIALIYDDGVFANQIQIGTGNSQLYLTDSIAQLQGGTAHINIDSGIDLGIVGDTGVVTGRLIYANTTSSAANVFVNGSGSTPAYLMSRSTSTRVAKRNIRDLDFNIDSFISINPVIFNYKEGYIRQEELNWDIVGFIAEDFIEAGLDTHLVKYPTEEEAAEGEVLQFKYEKLYMFLHKVVQSQDKKIKELEAIIKRNNLT